MNAYKNNPVVRAVARAVAMGVLAYFVLVLKAGYDAFSVVPFVWGLLSAVVYAVAGYFTPLEPKVGIKTNVQG